jgi:hypothetical protein
MNRSAALALAGTALAMLAAAQVLPIAVSGAYSAPAQSKGATLPLKRGFYTTVDQPCATGGNYTKYAAMLSFDGQNLSNSYTVRKILSVNTVHKPFDEVGGKRSPGSYAVQTVKMVATQTGGQSSVHPGVGGDPETVVWKITLSGSGISSGFFVNGKDHGDDWTGNYRFCGANLKAVEKSVDEIGD